MTNKTEHILARISHRRIDETRVLIVVDKYISGKTLKNILNDWEYNIMDSFVEPLSYRLDYPVSDFHQSLFKNNIYLSGQQDFTIHKNIYTTLANLINENIDHSYEL